MIHQWKTSQMEGATSILERGGKAVATAEGTAQDLHATIGVQAVANDFSARYALLHKSGDRRTYPFPGQAYPTTSVIDVPNAVKRKRRLGPTFCMIY